MQISSNQEINDSCQFVEISQFGVCLLKIFYQLMSVIKFLAAGIMKKSSQEKPQKERRPDQRYTTISPNTGIQGQLTKQQEKEKFRSKEMTSHIFKELTQQIRTIQKQTKGIFKQNEQQLQKIIKRHQKLQEIQSSQSEAVLAETVNLLFKRGEHINNFLNLLQSGHNQYNIKENETYTKLKEMIEEQNQQRIVSAKVKLSMIFKQQLKQFEKKKREEMCSQGIQVKMQTDEQIEGDKLRKSHNRKMHVDQIKKLKMEIRILQEENGTLKSYIKQKIEDYESLAIRLRAEKIKLENKLANIENNNGNMKSKGSIDYLKKPQTNFDQYDNIDNMSEVNSHFSLQQQGPKQNQINTQKYTLFKKSKVALGKNTKSRVKFQDISKNLEFISKIIEFSAQYTNNCEIQDQTVSPIEEHKSHKSLQKLQVIRKNRYTQKDQAQNEMQSINIKSVKREKSIERKRSQMKLVKNVINSRICSRNYKDQEIQNKQQKQQSNINSNKQEDLFIQSKQCQMNKKEICLKKKRRQRIIKKETIVQIVSQMRTKKDDINKEQEKEEIQMKKKIDSQDQQQNRHYNEKKACNLKKNRMPSRLNSTEVIQSKIKINFQSSKFQSDKKIKNMFERMNSNDKGEVKDIKFYSIDLIEIFITEENAKNYEILNLSLFMKKRNYFSSIQKKNILNEKKCQKLQKQNEDNFVEQQNRHKQNLNSLSMQVYKILNYYRKNQKYYINLCNFIRYPHSSIYLSQTCQWKCQQEERNLEYSQIRKLMRRLLKLHFYCKETICSHLTYFLKKIQTKQK